MIGIDRFMKSVILGFVLSLSLGLMAVSCAPSHAQDEVESKYDKAAIYSSIYWSDADAGG